MSEHEVDRAPVEERRRRKLEHLTSTEVKTRAALREFLWNGIDSHLSTGAPLPSITKTSVALGLSIREEAHE